MNEGAKRLLEEILAKPANMLDDYEISFLRARVSYLTDAQIREYEEVMKVPEVVEESEKEGGYSEMTAKELLALLEERQIEVPKTAKTKAAYVALLEEADAAAVVEE